MSNLNLSHKWIEKLQEANIAGNISSRDLDGLLLTVFPDKDKYPNIKKRIIESCAIAGYRNNINSVPILVCDDAPQFKQITEELALCWIHEGRHYKKLSPIYSWHRKMLDAFIGDFWDFYTELLEYRVNPVDAKRQLILKKFDNLFSQKTNYYDLDERISKTFNKKDELLIGIKISACPTTQQLGRM